MRFISAVLIVAATSTVGYAQQLVPLVAPRSEAPVRPLFPTAPVDSQAPQFGPVRTRPEPPSAFLPPSLVKIPGDSGAVNPEALARQEARQESRWSAGFGPVCLRAVPVYPWSDRSFLRPIPDEIVGSSTMRRLFMPQCVTLGSQPPR